MARRQTSSELKAQPPSIPPGKGIELLKRQIDAGQKLQSDTVINRNAYDSWISTTVAYVAKAFGEGSNYVTEFKYTGDLVSSPMNAGEAWWDEHRKGALVAKLARLESFITILTTEMELQEPAMQPVGIPTAKPQPDSRKVFVVHGHNETVRETCARFLERLGLEPIILHEKPNAGRTIIEKFHDYSDVGFAVVLLTADDKGGRKDADPATFQMRARQNVILELGFFLAKLGRTHVCALYESGVEVPSDYDGVLFVPLDAAGAWRFQLAREIKAAGIDVDLNKAM